MSHCVVTGGADGIGRAVVEQYAALGWAVTIIDRDAERAQAVSDAVAAHKTNVTFIEADLAQHNWSAAVLPRLATLPLADLVVHSAGISAVGAFAESDLVLQQSVLDVNLRAPLQLTAGMLRENQIAPGGSLVFISSLSVFTGYPGATVYAASKDGVAAYARSLRVALAWQELHVLTVFPGPTRTAHARRYSPDNRRENRRMRPQQLAALIVQAVQRRQAVLIPGANNQLFAFAGRIAPALTELLMRKTILEKLPRTSVAQSQNTSKRL